MNKSPNKKGSRSIRTRPQKKSKGISEIFKIFESKMKLYYKWNRGGVVICRREISLRNKTL